MQIVLTDLPGRHLWTGGNDFSEEGVWLWAGTGEAVNYTKWVTGADSQPNNEGGPEHCIKLSYRSRYDWNDKDCKSPYYSICEYELP